MTSCSIIFKLLGYFKSFIQYIFLPLYSPFFYLPSHLFYFSFQFLYLFKFFLILICVSIKILCSATSRIFSSIELPISISLRNLYRYNLSNFFMHSLWDWFTLFYVYYRNEFAACSDYSISDFNGSSFLRRVSNFNLRVWPISLILLDKNLT